MRHPILVLILAAGATAQTPALRTMRVDYVHSGTATEEQFALDGVVLEGRVAGTAGRLDRREQSGQVLFSGAGPGDQPRAVFARLREHLRRVGDHGRGEAGASRVFRESVRFPAPAGRCRW